jgi:hypothetical protein
VQKDAGGENQTSNLEQLLEVKVVFEGWRERKEKESGGGKLQRADAVKYEGWPSPCAASQSVQSSGIMG